MFSQLLQKNISIGYFYIDFQPENPPSPKLFRFGGSVISTKEMQLKNAPLLIAVTWDGISILFNGKHIIKVWSPLVVKFVGSVIFQVCNNQ